MDGDEFDPSREAAVARDREDPLAALRDRFSLPDDEFYMDGNSLGPLSTDAEESLARVVDEWRELGIRGWTDADPEWFDYGERLGARLAPLLGADDDEVVVTNSTTVNIHTLVGTFLDRLREEGGPTTVLANDLDFPTDHYAIRAQLRQRGLDPDDHLHLVESRDGRTVEEDDVVAALEAEDVGIVFMPSVLYRSGQLLDVERITEAAHEHGAYAGFDLAHSIGAVDHDLSAHGVDFAVWCTYKYLNAGPGSVGGLYVNERHFGTTPALAGWWGNDKETQFDMELTYTPARNAGAWQIGTVHVLSAAPLDGSLDVFAETTIEAVREKSVALTDALIRLVDERLPDCAVGTPRDAARRGGHVAIEHPEAYRVSLALKDRGVVVDFRQPNVVRVCPAPLYTSHADVWDAVEILREIVETEAYAEYEPRGAGVT
ncbi:Kynureninase [Halogranum amylolyticum]|uniref:Kynureninase n=1 Tax=Halogranum amylolyticum TaxID=660520 RepID=A0A1H8SMD7_9EURY|nr:kynureninase [Halogranum amylolyticum]SEO79852.1 Kynureninase [Halogranum amylolyticum]